ncbi:MAG: ABC transporter ATP-binding protein [Acutalibacteraceae bacterium]
MKRIFHYIKPYKWAFIFGPLLMITEVIGEILLPKLMANIINIGVAGHDTGYVIVMGVLMVVTALIMMVGGTGGAWFAAKGSVSMAADLRRDAFARVQAFSFANIDSFSTGSLVTRLTNDVTQVQNLVNMCMRMMLRAPGMLIGALIMSIAMNPSLSVILAVVIPVLVLTLFFVIRMAFPRFTAMQKKIDGVNSAIQENLTNVRVIKSFVRGDFEEEKFGKANSELMENSLRAFRVIITTMPIMMLAMNLTTLAVVWFGGQQVLAGGMAIGDLTAFITYVTQILMSLMMLSMVIMQSSRATASLRRINEVLDAKVDLTDENASQKDLKVKNGKVEFRNVSFRYYKNSEEKVLSGVSFTAQPGEVVGIIGSTGSGKTTLVQMIPRLYDVDEGQVLVDGVDVRDYSLKNLRDGVGMVLQKNVLFSGTIRENLMWGNEKATEEEIRSAAQSAQALDFVESFSDGMDTMLDQGGTNVSGGQKQRLCIARALLKKPKILILDDSTSAVDTATERRIRESFSKELKDSTKLIIAQRITSVMDADRIIVLDEGGIVGMGTHDELMKTSEEYREIYDSQMEREAKAQ